MRTRHPILLSVVLSAALLPAGEQPPSIPVGVATVDITPPYPVCMYGYASRKTESEGVAGRLHAKAMAIGGDGGGGPALLLSVDCGAVPAALTAAVLEHLRSSRDIAPERFVLCNTHTHAGPNVKGASRLPMEQRDRLLGYSTFLRESLEKVAGDALAARRQCRLAWAEGTVGFAANRRVLENGKWTGFGAVLDAPADRSMAVLRVTDVSGNVVAVLVNYACHATTLRADFKQIHGDWPGSAQENIEADQPGAAAMVCIGCGADADPYPHGTLELARKHGRALADEVKRLLAGPMTPIDPRLAARRTILQIPYEKTASGEKRPVATYPITTWSLGEDLTVVFLTGEVVVDYARRLRGELAGRRLWITAYAHEVPCYIVSRRIIGEGGYEARNSLSARVSGGRPEAVQPPMEDRIVQAVCGLLGAGPED